MDSMKTSKSNIYVKHKKSTVVVLFLSFVPTSDNQEFDQKCDTVLNS
jgi:hypothetical protein